MSLEPASVDITNLNYLNLINLPEESSLVLRVMNPHQGVVQRYYENFLKKTIGLKDIAYINTSRYCPR